MTDEQMNRIIHEKIMGECWHEFDTSKSLTCIKCPDGFVIDGNPNYTTDLNAVALAEARVIEAKGIQYLFACLSELVETFETVAFACPEERAEACLMAMDLWEG
jgi:hypothetical protein